MLAVWEFVAVLCDERDIGLAGENSMMVQRTVLLLPDFALMWCISKNEFVQFRKGI